MNGRTEAQDTGEGTVPHASLHLGDTQWTEGVHAPELWDSFTQEKVQDARISQGGARCSQVALPGAGRAQSSLDIDSHVPVTLACLWGVPGTLAEGLTWARPQGKMSGQRGAWPPRTVQPVDVLGGSYSPAPWRRFGSTLSLSSGNLCPPLGLEQYLTLIWGASE